MDISEGIETFHPFPAYMKSKRYIASMDYSKLSDEDLALINSLATAASSPHRSKLGAKVHSKTERERHNRRVAKTLPPSNADTVEAHSPTTNKGKFTPARLAEIVEWNTRVFGRDWVKEWM